MIGQQLVRGSLQDVSIHSKTGIAQAFLGVSALVLVDTSGSMDMPDCPGGRRRFEVAREQLIRLQRDLPGKIGLISWNTNARFCPSGLPEEPTGGTNLAGALELVKHADGTDIQIIVISDGEPDSETDTLALARTFTSKIDTIFVGPETSPGRDFLRRLAEASGGKAVSQSVKELPQLSQSIQGLLTTTH